MSRYVLMALSVLVIVPGATADQYVIAHRGASGYVPEHTLEAYAMAHAMGADWIEQDLVMTQDGRFVCLHDIHLEMTTDVEQRFPDRARKDNRWYAADFSLAELKTLNVHERLPNRFPQGASRFEIPTFEEAIELIQGINKTTGREAGLEPELKAPSFPHHVAMNMEERFWEICKKYGYDKKESKLCVQSFEPKALKKLRELGCPLPMLQLIAESKIQDRFVTEAGLDDIAKYATAIGPNKERIVANPDIVTWAHARGLDVQIYTLHADAVPSSYPDFNAEMDDLYTRCGIDGAFSDHPDKTAAFLKQK